MGIITHMARQRIHFWIDEELRAGMRVVSERDGIAESEQVRRAIRLWLEEKGVSVKSKKRTAGAPATRRRP